ncbi:hypothetical protein GCM10022255_114900 [Dactylosporangium darangshiense]|uniref:Uncharacterized protein n=1 Tax=Dactylosporangium darangshiense TaxID=579108 RepID=A0ABP8DW31_9ACTN
MRCVPSTVPFRARLSIAARLLLDEAAEARLLWIVLQDEAAARSHPVLGRALRLVVDPEPAAGVPAGHVLGEVKDGRRLLRAAGRDVPAAVAAVLLAARDHTDVVPRLSCAWPERHPLAELAGLADPAVMSVPRLRALLHRAEPDPARRPVVHTW